VGLHSDGTEESRCRNDDMLLGQGHVQLQALCSAVLNSGSTNGRSIQFVTGIEVELVVTTVCSSVAPFN
jgi:hypothetical protein